MQSLELKEEADEYFPETSISVQAALQLHDSKKFEVEFPSPTNLNRYRVRSKGWIGYLPLKGGPCIRVLPKCPVGNVFKMLDLVFNLGAFQIYGGNIEVSELSDVFEKLASILARRILLRVQKGLYRNYLTERETLTVVKGRVDLAESVKSIYRDGKICCEFQEFTANLIENQILLWTLNILPRFGFERPKVANEIRQARKALLNTIELREVRAFDCINRSYNRLNIDYQPLHGICRFFIENGGPGLESGGQDFVPFMVSMPLLFEAYVAEWLNANLPNNFRLRRQFDAQLEANADLKFRIDLVLEDLSKGPIAVLDTKHKNSEVPTETDIQKAAAYALRMGTSHAFLVYSSTSVKPVKIKLGHVLVQTANFDISGDPSKGGEAFLADLLKEITLPD